MQLDQFAHIFNVSGFAIVLAVSAAVLPTFARPYYRSWLGAYSFGFIFLSAETIATFVGRSAFLAALGLGSVLAMIWFLHRTRLLIEERPPIPGRWFFLLFVPAMLGIIWLLFLDQFNLAAVLPALLLTVGYVMLGRSLLRHVNAASPQAVWWLGYPLIITGLLPLAFPLIVNTRLEWIGYYMGGLLNLLTGISMLVFLLQDAALQFQRKNEELMRLDLLKSNLISTMSHEFRTPLTAIKSASWLLGRMPEKSDDLIATLTGNVDHLDRLVSDVLDFSQMEAGLMRYRKEDASLSELARQVAQALWPLSQQKKVALTVSAPEPDVRAEVDVDKVGIVLRNLVSNALKFTPAGGSVEIRLADEGDQVVLAVTDTGIGIADEHQRQIFEKFFQVDNSATRKVGGTGLGLAISRAIVEDGHQGSITVKSRPGAGSTFMVRLPAHGASPNGAT